MENIEIKYFKALGIYSAIFGAVCAILSLIPFFAPFLFLFFVPFLGAFAPLMVLIIKDKFDSEDIPKFALLGAISGVCVCTAYIFVLIPLVLIIHAFNKSYYSYGVPYLGMLLITMFLIMFAIIYAASGAVIGMGIGYAYNYFKRMNK